MLAAAAVAALVAAGLAGCSNTNVGLAARVNDGRITETAVGEYLTSVGASPKLAAQASQAGQHLAPPRSLVLEIQIQERLFVRTLHANGGVPDAGALSRSREAASQVLLNGQSPAVLATRLVQLGVKASFTPTVLRTTELEYTLISRRKLTSTAELAALVNKAGADVRASTRYGVWIPSQLRLDSTASAPDFVSLQPTPTTSPAPLG